MDQKNLEQTFFDRDAQIVARDLLGKIIRVKRPEGWLAAQIVETEAYYLAEKASHASLGFTDKRAALFMPPGTIYMYHARGGPSLNFSCRGAGNAVLIKAGRPFPTAATENALALMQTLNPVRTNGTFRPAHRLCAGQTLLCRSLGLEVKIWDQQQLDPERFTLVDVGEYPARIIQTTRLGIPAGRDGHLTYRFIHFDHVRSCTRNPMRMRDASEGKTYTILEQ